MTVSRRLPWLPGSLKLELVLSAFFREGIGFNQTCGQSLTRMLSLNRGGAAADTANFSCLCSRALGSSLDWHQQLEPMPTDKVISEVQDADHTFA